jgi:hypothetical protein
MPVELSLGSMSVVCVLTRAGTGTQTRVVSVRASYSVACEVRGRRGWEMELSKAVTSISLLAGVAAALWGPLRW